MDQELKARWIADLRAHQESQGRGFLQRDGKFCCLGRLAEIEGVPSREYESGICFYDFGFGQENTGFLSSVWTDKRSLSSESCNALIGMNDDGRTFAEIADWIEKNL